MALGTDYKRQGDRDDQRIEKNLARHFKLMEKYIKEGLSKEAASKKAFKDITGFESRE